MGISTPRNKLIGWPVKTTAALAKTFKKTYKGLKHIRPKIKNDISDRALGTKESVLRARRKTIALFKRPMNDVSHIGIMLVISLALLSGVSAMFGTKEQIAVNPFATQKVAAQTYVSNSEKRLMQADLVTTLASIHSDNLGVDAATTTEGIYKQAALASTAQSYIASVPIVDTVSNSTAQNNPIKYTVQGGDTLSAIAVKFNITTDTIRYANQLENVDDLKPGQTLTILPTTGVLHTVKTGETLAQIASRYSVNESMIVSQNDLYGVDLSAGMKLMIPDAEIPEAPKPVVATSSGSSASVTQTYSRVITSVGPNHFPWGWCTWYVASRRYVPWSGNASDWYWNAQAYGRSVGRTPVPGAIMVTWESGWGHVAYVESVSGGTFTVSEMNYVGFGVVSQRTLTTSQVPLIGFIY